MMYAEIVETRAGRPTTDRRRALESCSVRTVRPADLGRWQMAVVTSTRVAPQSSRMWRIRAGGDVASSGTYAPRRPEHRQDRDHRLDRSLHEHGNRLAGLHARVSRAAWPSLHIAAQLAECQLARTLTHGDSVGRAPAACFSKSSGTVSNGQRSSTGVVETHQQSLTLLVREEIDVSDTAVGIVEQRRENPLEMRDRAPPHAPAETPPR